MQNTLGILVHSAHYFEHVHMLAHAAIEKGKQVHIHLLQEGVLFVGEEAFDRLCQTAMVTICEKSMVDMAASHHFEHPPSQYLTSSYTLADFLSGCDRWVAF